MIHLEPFTVQQGGLPYELASAENTVKELITSIYDIPEEDALDKLSGLCFLAKPTPDSDTVIGVVNLDPTAPDRLELPNTAWINALVVAEEYRRGGENGQLRVGSNLAERVISIAERLGAGRIALESVTEPGSLKFWKEQGFSIAQNQPATVTLGTELMTRPL